MENRRWRPDLTTSKPYAVKEAKEYSRGKHTSTRDVEVTPESLNLQAPFRMGHETLPAGKNVKQREIHGKRPRNSASDSSVLEPLSRDMARRDQQHMRSKFDGYEPEGGSDSSFESIIEEPLVPVQKGKNASSEHQMQPKTYERRPRHKTRPDLYDIKPPKGKENARPRNEKQRSQTGKANRRRGSSGLPKLRSEYVLTERLTMKPSYNLGLFGKARTSSGAPKPGLPDLAFSEMRFLQKPRQSRLGNSENPPAVVKHRKPANDPDVQGELSTYFASVKETPKTEGTVQDGMHNSYERNDRIEGSPIQSAGHDFVRGSPTPIAPDLPSPQFPKHDLPRTEEYKSSLIDPDDPCMFMPREQTTPRPSTLSTLLSDPYSWSPSLLQEERNGCYTGLGIQNHKHPVMFSTGIPHKGVLEQQPLPLRRGGRDTYVPAAYFGLYQADLRSSSAHQPRQESSEAPNGMKGFWRPHKLY
ncbi:MAG: hypothetical protein M1816_005712 [Peltula sp. TS41687]|nr:MAG: hypothetical protein M1816_005712 [Peltula sp. TS41687]